MKYVKYILTYAQGLVLTTQVHNTARVSVFVQRQPSSTASVEEGMLLGHSRVFILAENVF